MKILKRFCLGMLPVLAGVATAATFNLFQPATGILKGNASTYVTTAAVSSDVIATFTGTCNNGTYLRGDGTCNTPPGTGVSSVGLAMPSGFSVGGSPITSSGTLSVTTTLNGVVHGNGSGLSASNVLLGSEVTGTLPVGNGGSGATTLTGVLHGNGASAFTASNVALASEVTGTLPVANGGTGAGTLTGLLKGNGTSAFTAATSSDVIGLWTGTCNGSSFLRGDGACAAAGGGTVTSVALTMPSGFSVGGSPVTTTGTLAVSTTLNGPLRGNGSGFTTGATALGSEVSGTLPVGNGGTGTTTSTGSGSVVLSASPTLSGTITGGAFSGDGSALTNLNASNLASGTVPTARFETTGTTTCNLAGFTGTVTTTIRYNVYGDNVTLRFGIATGTSNTTSMSCAAGTLPAAARPAGGSGSNIAVVVAEDNGADVVACARVVSDGSINFGRCSPGAGFTGSGTKGFGEDASLTYTIN